MPIYEYQCEKCSETMEVLQKFSDAPLTDCPKCSGQLSKLMSMNSFHLKGGGWYVTDYANKKETSDKSTPAKDTPDKAATTNESGSKEPTAKPEAAASKVASA